MELFIRLFGVINALFLFCWIGLSPTLAQTFVIEEFMVHDGSSGIADLEGQTTYRFYLELTHPEDFVSAIYGGDEAPMSLNLTSPMFNTPFASGATAGGVNPIILNYFPEVAFDSWITIGLEHAPAGAGQSDVSAMESPNQPYLQNFVSGSATDGEGFEISDGIGGAWFVLNGTANGYAGEDLRVLVMQVTTAELPSGILNAQIIPADDSVDAIQVQQGYEGTDVWDLLPPGSYPGCTDPLACNYDASASEDDGSCEYDTCLGCTDVWACNYDPAATTEDGTCDYLTCSGCTDVNACNYDPNAIYFDGSCEYVSCANVGCTNSSACNYDPEATYNDGSCDFTSCLGCTDESAQNYDPEATQDDGSCDFPGCLNPLACNYDPTANVSNGTCEYTSCIGCMNSAACNYDPEASISDASSCSFPANGYDCAGVCLNDSDGDGVCDEFEVLGCTDPEASNYSSNATEDNGSCTYVILGCINPLACNFDPEATVSNGSCEFVSCVGCMNPAACNYDESFTVANNMSCVFAAAYYNCEGNCLGDNDGDGVCNELEVIGCTFEEALNFNPNATDTDDSCIFPASCNDVNACNYSAYEGYCLQIEEHAVHTGVIGDMDLSGYKTYRVYALCNHTDDFVSAVAGDDVFPSFIHTTTSFFQAEVGGALAQDNNPLIFPFIPEAEFDSWVTIGISGPANSGLGEQGVSVVQGSSPWVAPFEAGGSLNMSDDVGGSWFILNGASNGVAGDDLKVLLGQFTTDGNLDGQLYIQFFEHGNGTTGGFNKLISLHDACELPAFDSCEYAEEHYTCEGACLEDLDGDGVCDALEIPGCMDAQANNFDPLATDDDGSCDFSVDPCLDDVVAPYFTSVPADSTVLCSQPMPTQMATAEDDCDNNVQVIFIDGPIEFVLECPPYNYLCTRTFYATDDAGNVAQATQIITVVDTIAPEILNLPADSLFINEIEGESIPVPFIAIQDACDSNAEWSAQDEMVDTDGETATYHRTYTTFDACGNSDEWVQTISVILATYGCMDALACNYSESATNDDASCTYPEDFVNCDGVCYNDMDGDGVCDELEILGCTVTNACNFDPAASEEDGSCDYCSCADDEIPVFGLEIDTVAVHEEGPLAGQITYRFYITTESSDDFVSSIYGNDLDTLQWLTTEAWYQDAGGSALAQNINPELFMNFPELEFDSWITVGVDGPLTVGQNTVNTVGSIGPNGWLSQFEMGNNIVLNTPVGGAWFILNGGTNGVAGDDLRVLIGQVTTGGEMSGRLNVQIFENGDNDLASNHTFEFNGTTWTNPVSSANSCGCTDPEALNYDSTAEYDNGECVYPVFGCVDALACNFNELATTDDGSCWYAEDGYDCEGVCLNDVDLDGICDEFEISGCTDVEAINFNEEATDDDGSCVYCALMSTVEISNVSCAGAMDGQVILFVSGGSPLDSALTYQLLPEGEIVEEPVFDLLSGGSYTVLVTDESGCELFVEFEILEPEPLLVLLDEVVGSPEGESAGSISVTIDGGTAPFEYQWSNAEGTFNSDQEDLTDLFAGVYQLNVTDANGCSTTSFEITVEEIVGVEELGLIAWSTFPNPVSNELTIQFDPADGLSRIEFYDASGRKVYEHQVQSSINRVDFNVGSWSRGHYYVALHFRDQVKSNMIMIQ